MLPLDLPVANVHEIQQAGHWPEVAMKTQLPSKSIFPFLPAGCGHVALFDEAGQNGGQRAILVKIVVEERGLWAAGG